MTATDFDRIANEVASYVETCHLRYDGMTKREVMVAAVKVALTEDVFDAEAEQACGRTCDTCPAVDACRNFDPEGPDVDMAEVALQRETGTGYLTELS